MRMGFKRTEESPLQCSFCRKPYNAVEKLISSPPGYTRSYICDECIDVCNTIIAEDRAGSTQALLPEPEAEHEPEAEIDPFWNHPASAELRRSVETWIRKDALGERASQEAADVRRIGRRILAEKEAGTDLE